MPLEPGTYLVDSSGQLNLIKIIEVDRFLDSQNVLYWYWVGKPELILPSSKWYKTLVVIGKVLNES